MSDRKEVIKHLEMIQGIVNRLGHDSFLIKGWSTVMPSVIILFMIRYDMYSEAVCLLLLFPIIFWGLDAYYLWQERLFRSLYDEVRKQDKTDFSMEFSPKVKAKHSWSKVLWSRTILAFYATQIAFILLIYFLRP